MNSDPIVNGDNAADDGLTEEERAAMLQFMGVADKDAGAAASSAAASSSNAATGPVADESKKEDDSEEPEVPTRPKHTQLVGEETATVHVVHASEEDRLSPHLQAVSNWEDLMLTEELLKGIVAKGFLKPSRIQEAALPCVIRSNKNLIAQAQSGSGKTATFALGMLAKIDFSVKSCQAICVCPTRELAKQNLAVIEELGKYTGIKMMSMLGQDKIDIGAAKTTQIIVGTPGKLADQMKRKTIRTDTCRIFCLDEADVMIDPSNSMGQDVQQMHKMLSAGNKTTGVQVLLFSATFAEDMRRFAMQIAPQANKIIVKKEELTLKEISQMFIDCETEENKFRVLSDLYGCLNIGQSIIFLNKRELAFKIAHRMKNEEGHPVSLICGTGKGPTGAGEMNPELRDRVLKEFREGKTKVLIATDVLARGIDVPAVTLVINYEFPMDRGSAGEVEYETYLHRIGRTGRFGAKGIAINLVTPLTRHHVESIKKYYKCDITQVSRDPDYLERALKQLR